MSETRSQTIGYLRLCQVVMWLALELWGSPTLGQSLAGQSSATDYRRLFVPADSPDTWPTNGERYLPLDADQFEELLREARAENTRAAVGARLIGATYRARLVDDTLLTGTVEYHIESLGTGPRVTALEPMNLAIVSLKWQGEPPTPAKWGLWKTDPAKEVWGVLTPQSGILRADWQLRMQSDDQPLPAEQTLEFLLQLPSATPQTMELTLPQEYRASLPSAKLVRVAPATNGEQHWEFQLASHGPHQLRLLRQPTTEAPQSQLRLSQATEYRLQPHGLELTSTFRCEPREALVNEVSFSVSRNLKITGIVLDDEPIEWHQVATAGGPELRLRLPSSTLPQELKVRALAPIRLDDPWQLPVIRPLRTGWTEGTVLLVVSADLELLSITSESATIEHIVGLQSQEAYRVQEWSDRALLEVVVARRRPRLQVAVATATDLGANETTARIAARFACQDKPAYQIAATVASGWSIESVEAEPAVALREWHVEDQGEHTTLLLQLNRPVQPDTPLMIRFDARAQQRGTLLPTVAEKLRVLTFVDVTEQRQLVLLRSPRQGRMRLLHGMEQARVVPEQLVPHEQALLPSPTVGELVDLTLMPANHVVALRPVQTRYETHIAAELQAYPQSTSQLFKFSCQPVDGQISEVVVQFDEPLPDSAEWSMLGGATGDVSRQLPEPENEGSTKYDGVVYRLKLPHASEEEVRLSICYTTAAKGSAVWNKIRFPQADRWSGQVALRGSLEGWRVDDTGWTPVGQGNSASGEDASLSLLGCYRWESSPASGIKRISPLTVRRTEVATQVDALVAWLAEYQSHQSADGAAIYSAVYYLENSGGAEVEFQLDEYATLQACWLDHQQLAPRDLQVEDGRFRVRLTEEQRYPILVLQYVVRGPALGRATTIKPVLPNYSFPVHLSRWTLWTPEQFVPDDLVTGYSARRVPWRQRLFGPLARSLGQETFQPLRARDWPQLWSAPVEGLRTRLLAELFASRLATRMGGDGEQTWGQLLGDLVKAMSIEKIVSLDTTALHAARIEPNQRPGDALEQATDDDGAVTAEVEQRASQLASHGLALVVSPSRVIVTTSDRVAHWSEDLRPTATPRVYYVHSEHLLFELETKINWPKAEIVSVAEWKSAPAPTQPVWHELVPSTVSDVGHRACTIEFVDQVPSVVVRRARVQQAYWYVAWLATVVAGVWWLARRTDWFVLVLAGAAAACLVAPPYWLTIPQAVLVGLLSAFGLRLVTTYVSLVNPDETTRTIMVRATPIVLLLCLMLRACESIGAPISNGQFDSRLVPPQVLVPIDNNAIRQGDDVYLSEAFLFALRNAVNGIDRNAASYLLHAASIRGDLQNIDLDRSELVEPWRISIEVECLQPRCLLELPFHQEDGTWINQQCTLDDKQVPINWLTDAQGCRIEILDPGLHCLELTVRPRIEKSADGLQLRLHVPRLPGTRLELTTGSAIEDLQIENASSIQFDKATGVTKTVLATTNVLRLAWSEVTRQSLAEIVSEIDLNSWLWIEQTVARLKVQLVFRGPAAPPRQLRLRVAPHLKLLPPDELSSVEQVVSRWDQPGTLLLRLKRGLGPNTRIPLTFQLQRTASLGKFFYPTVRLEGTTLGRSLFAASVGSGLSYHEEGTEEMRSISSSEFTAEWGNGTDSPLFAYSFDLDRDDPDWSLRVWPDPESFSVQQSLQMHCQLHEAQIEYNADVSQVFGKCLIHRLRAPAGMEIEEITVSEQASDNSLPIRWTRPDSSHVTVFLDRPTSRPHVLRLRGRIRATPGGNVAVPQIVLQGAERGEIRFDLYRDPGVLVTWTAPRTAPLKISQEPSARNSTEILVGRYKWRANEPSSNRFLNLRENRRSFTADTVTTVEATDEGQTVKLSARVRVLQGVIDQLQLSAPSSFQEPYVLHPVTLGVVEQIEDSDAGRLITVLFDRPVREGEVLELQCSGQLISSADGLLAIPDLLLNKSRGGTRFVMLPTQLDQRDMEWRTAGLKREPLPKDMQSLSPATTKQLPYKIVSRRFSAQEPPYRGPLRNAALRQALVDGVLDARGSLTATASFVMQPGRATHCSVRLPEGARLMQLVTDGSPVRRDPLANGAWRIPLGPPLLPRVIQISYLVESQAFESRIHLVPPEVLIGDATLPCPVVDWQIRPVGGLRIRPTAIGSKTSRTIQAESRYRILSEVWGDSAALAAELPVDEVGSWFRAWESHLHNAWREANAEYVTTDEELVLRVTPRSGKKPVLWQSLFEGEAAAATIAALSPSPTYPPTVPRQPTSSLGTGAVYLTSDPVGQLEIGCSQLTVGNAWRWLAALVALAVGIMLEKRLQFQPEWISALHAWPHLLAFALGVTWWSLLTPSVVGLLIVILTGFSISLKQWRKHHPPPGMSVSTQLTARMS